MSDKRQRLQQEASEFFGRGPSESSTTSSTGRGSETPAPAPAAGRPAPTPRAEALVHELAVFRGQASSGTTPTTPGGTPVVPVPYSAPSGSTSPTKSTPAPTQPYTVVLLSLPDSTRWLGFARRDGTYVRTSEWPAAAEWNGPTVTLTEPPPVLGTQSKPATPTVASPATAGATGPTGPTGPTLRTATYSDGSTWVETVRRDGGIRRIRPVGHPAETAYQHVQATWPKPPAI